MIKDLIYKIKNKVYLIIPISCIVFWAFIALYKDGLTLIPAADFSTLYYASKVIFVHPERLYFLEDFYESQQYTYTPFFPTIFFPMGLLPYEQAHWFYYFVILIFTLLCIITFDQILILKDVSNKFHRLIYLIALFNGIIWVQMFDTLTGRIFTAFGLLWFLKREIKYRILDKDLTETKFIFTQMMILMFAFGMTLQYVFLVLLYIFHKVKINEIFSKFQIKRYLLLVISFIIQNFMLVVIYYLSPESILNLLGGHWRGERSLDGGSGPTYSSLLESRARDPVDTLSTVIIVLSMHYNLSNITISILLISILIMSVLTFIIHLCKNLSIEEKFGFWALASLFFYSFTQNRYFVGLLPLIAILFLNFEFKSNEKIIGFFKKNFLILIGIGIIMLLFFLPPIHYLIRVFPFLMNIPIEIMLFKFTYAFIILCIVLFLLYRKRKKDVVQINNLELTASAY